MQLISTFIIGSGIIFNWLFYVSNKNILLTVITLSGLLINITISTLLIFYFKLGVFGGSIGTLISTLFIFLFKVIYIAIINWRTKIILPIINFWKYINIKNEMKKWYAIPYEIIFFLTGYIFFFLLNIYYPSELTLYSVFSPFMYAILGSSGMAQIYMKYSYDNQSASQNNKIKILKISWVRLNVLAVIIILIFAFIIFGTKTYNISSRNKELSFTTFALSTLALSMTSPLYNMSFNYALLSKTKLNFYVSDISARLFLIIFIVVSGYAFSGVIAFIATIVFFQIIQSILPWFLVNLWEKLKKHKELKSR